MKIAISGKGGVGKSTLAAALSLLIAKQGRKILAVDADPDPNLASALGVPDNVKRSIVPIAEQAALIEERTGAKVKQYGQIFKLNPEVSDIAEKFAVMHNGVALLVLGGIETGGSGCACPENTLLRALVSDLVLYNEEAMIMDMTAGVEHLGRATARGVDTMIVVVEPGQRSIDCARRIMKMSNQIGIKDMRIAGNKVSCADDENFIRRSFDGISIIGMIPFTDELRSADRNNISVLDGISGNLLSSYQSILSNLDGC